MSTLDELFRGAMRRVAATVNIITIVDEHSSPMGMTATAVSSLSAEPPSLLICVNQSASMHDQLALAPHFCVNVLHGDQSDIAKRFSDKSLREVRFASGGWKRTSQGLPFLPEAQAHLTCSRTQIVTFATHSICIGTVEDISVREDIDPLVYLEGRFGRFAA